MTESTHTNSTDTTRQPVFRLDWEEASRLVNDAHDVIILAHIRPDGDAIGSMCALGLALMERGKNVTMAVDGGINDYLSFVPGSHKVKGQLRPKMRADLVITCDISDLHRMGENGVTAFAIDAPRLVIDHHATNTFFGDVHLVHEDYVSTCEAILRWFDYMEWDISEQVATALTIGFMTDTISFRVGPVTSETLGQVQRLMQYGANLKQIIERMIIRVEPGQLKLMGVGLSRLEVQDHVAWTYLTMEDFRINGLNTADKPELSTEILRDPRVYVACFFLETEEGDVRLSMRGTPGFDVGSIAFDLGGGGHMQAAGATLERTKMEDAIARVIPLLKEAAQRGEPLYK